MMRKIEKGPASNAGQKTKTSEENPDVQRYA